MFFVIALVISFVGVGVTSAAATPAVYGRYRVDTEIGVHIIDDDTLRPDRHCAFSGTTTQELVTHLPGQPWAQLGTGRPQIDYPRNRGPFRDGAGTPILFVCGDLSVCFHPSTVSVNITATLTVLIDVTLYRGTGLAMPCDPANLLSSTSLDIGVQGEPGDCLPRAETIGGHGHDRVHIGAFCASATYLGPAVEPLAVASLVCLSFDGTYGCDAMLTGGVAPIGIRWHLNGAHDPAFDDRSTLTGRCSAGFLINVEVFASDPAAHRARRSTTLRCQ
jgi:hypothetical protein